MEMVDHQLSSYFCIETKKDEKPRRFFFLLHSSWHVWQATFHFVRVCTSIARLVWCSCEDIITIIYLFFSFFSFLLAFLLLLRFSPFFFCSSPTLLRVDDVCWTWTHTYAFTCTHVKAYALFVRSYVIRGDAPHKRIRGNNVSICIVKYLPFLSLSLFHHPWWEERER